LLPETVFDFRFSGREPAGGKSASGGLAATCQRGGHAADLHRICRQFAVQFAKQYTK
jgi:hypothetical protein